MPEENRSRLMMRYLPNVKRIVDRYAARVPDRIEKDELMSAGVIGLIGALGNYTPERENTFSAYADYRIKGAVIEELRARDFLSRKERKKIREMEETWVELEKKLGRPASDEEVAEKMNLNIEEFDHIRTSAGYTFIGFDESPGGPANPSLRNMSDPFAVTERNQLVKEIQKVLETLGEKEKLVISLYYREELTMKEIGKILNLTESRICQIHARAMIKLRGRIRTRGLMD